ncbi:MAG TPA: DUF1501 domain-containing protein [Planctomycetaceae bacterium]|nr:DUF1501 domain-containing protein [Planctomycetaceae bacterium]
MQCTYACQSADHGIARRQFLGTVAAGLGASTGLGFLTRPAAAKELAAQQKRVCVFYMHGGLSQLESWDPKPQTDTGGPFRAIPTSVPGVHLCELLPMTAQQMHHLALIRSINTKEDDHGKGQYLMLKGRRQTPGSEFPELGAVVAKAIAPEDGGLPGHIRVANGGGGGRSNDAAYLGPKFGSVVLGGDPPQNSARPDGLTETADDTRNAFRQKVNDRFATRRRTAETDAYTYNYEQAQQLMRRRDVFDLSKEADSEHDRYGRHDLGKHTLLARRLLEHGITFVKVSHSNYDTHNENFNFHLEQLGEFDRSFATFVADLADRGMLDSTLIVVISEFGRTPNINQYYGRDHWSRAWSICVGGAKVHPGAVIGKTNENGTAVADREVDHGHLFHTYLQALGLDSKSHFNIGGREVPMADPAYDAIAELIA